MLQIPWHQGAVMAITITSNCCSFYKYLCKFYGRVSCISVFNLLLSICFLDKWLPVNISIEYFTCLQTCNFIAFLHLQTLNKLEES